MPISRSNRKRYPKNWKEIRAAVRDRSGNRCECIGECGRNHTWNGDHRCVEMNGTLASWRADKDVVVVLTVAHLDHTPEHNSMDNLRHYCQPCHNRYDVEHRKKNRARTRDSKLGPTML